MTHRDRALRRLEIAEAVRSGMTRQEAAKRYGVTAATVWTACQEYGVITNTNRSMRSAQSFRILFELLRGKQLDMDIAERYGISKQRVSQIKMAASEAGFVFFQKEVTTNPKRGTI